MSLSRQQLVNLCILLSAQHFVKSFHTLSNVVLSSVLEVHWAKSTISYYDKEMKLREVDELLKVVRIPTEYYHPKIESSSSNSFAWSFIYPFLSFHMQHYLEALTS